MENGHSHRMSSSVCIENNGAEREWLLVFQCCFYKNLKPRTFNLAFFLSGLAWHRLPVELLQMTTNIPKY